MTKTRRAGMPAISIAISLAAFVGLAAAGGPLLAAAGRPAETAFTVLREGAPFGSHTVFFRRDGDSDIVDIAIDLEVRFAFVTLFRYSHRNTEVWRDGRLVRLDAVTDDDGKRYRVSAEATADGIRVQTPDRTYLAPADTMPTSYWNRDIVDRTSLLNTQTGEPMPVAVERLADETLTGADGAIPAARYRFVNRDNGRPFEVWYDRRDNRWVKLTFDARGSRIDYALAGLGSGPSTLR
jgi:hypothetical protein